MRLEPSTGKWLYVCYWVGSSATCVCGKASSLLEGWVHVYVPTIVVKMVGTTCHFLVCSEVCRTTGTQPPLPPPPWTMLGGNVSFEVWRHHLSDYCNIASGGGGRGYGGVSAPKGLGMKITVFLRKNSQACQDILATIVVINFDCNWRAPCNNSASDLWSKPEFSLKLFEFQRRIWILIKSHLHCSCTVLINDQWQFLNFVFSRLCTSQQHFLMFFWPLSA